MSTTSPATSPATDPATVVAVPHAPGVPTMLYDLAVNPPRRPYSHMEKGLLTEAHEVENLLAAALGYEPYPPGSPGYHPEHVNYVVGDHTTVTLAMQAARTLADLRARLAADPA